MVSTRPVAKAEVVPLPGRIDRSQRLPDLKTYLVGTVRVRLTGIYYLKRIAAHAVHGVHLSGIGYPGAGQIVGFVAAQRIEVPFGRTVDLLYIDVV